MKIIKLILTGNTRLALGGKWRVEYTPTKDFQLIIGTNGSGKSSLMRELTPLPAVAADYDRDGSKIIQFEHNNIIYTCESTFKNGAKHSFLRGDEELNAGGTASVQKELCYREFGITSEIHALLTDQIRFTDMTPMQRRYWISEFCTTDLDYANSLWNSIKSKARDTVGAIKHIHNRLSVEMNKLLEFEDIEKLEIQAKTLREELNILMQERENGLPGSWEQEQVLMDSLQKLESYSRQLLEIKVNPPRDCGLPEQHDIRHVEDSISDLRQNIGIGESMLTHYNTEYSELDTIMKKLNDTGAGGIDELEERLSDLDEDENEQLNSIESFYIQDNPEDARNDTKVALESLTSILNALPVRNDNPITPDSYREIKEKVDNYKYTIDRCQNRIHQIKQRVEHMSSAKENSCPKCNYTWREGVSEGEVEKLNELILSSEAEIKVVTPRLQAAQEELEIAEEYVQGMRRYRHLVASYPRLKPLWDIIADKELVTTSPEEAMLLAYQWDSDIHTSCILASIRKEKASLKEALEHARRLSQNDSGVFSDRVGVLQENIEKTTERLQVLRSQMQRLKDYQETLKRIATYKGEIARLVQRVNETTELLQRVIRDEMLGETIGKHQTTLSMVQTALNEKSTLEGIVNDLNNSAERLAMDSEAYQILMTELSPTEGIIAEQMMGAIHTITSHMNAIISAIWTYDLVVQDCGTDKGELTYKFPLSIGNSGAIRDDISKGSSSYLDIVNFAFKLVAYSQLDIEHFPLYLDEFGRTFDPEHLKRAMSYIQGYSETRTNSQIFMINHLENYYGNFSQAEILVLDSTNVTIPYEHNLHVKID